MHVKRNPDRRCVVYPTDLSLPTHSYWYEVPVCGCQWLSGLLRCYQNRCLHKPVFSPSLSYFHPPVLARVWGGGAPLSSCSFRLLQVVSYPSCEHKSFISIGALSYVLYTNIRLLGRDLPTRAIHFNWGARRRTTVHKNSAVQKLDIRLVFRTAAATATVGWTTTPTQQTRHPP